MMGTNGLMILIISAVAAWPAVVEDFTTRRTSGAQLQDRGEFTREGWCVTTERCQMKWDLGRHCPRGTVEFDVKGPLRQQDKRSLFSAWNEEAASDGGRKTRGVFQLRVMRGSLEAYTGPRPWKASAGSSSERITTRSSSPSLVCRNLKVRVEGPAEDPQLDLYFPPPGEGLDVQSRVTPEEAGFAPGVIAALEEIAPRWALWRNGRLVHVKGDFNETSDVASQRKTWHALTVGAALQLGKIQSLDQRIREWNKDLTGEHGNATWWHVMTQSAGFDYPYGKYPAYPPGRMWTYSDYNPVNLCNALARVWGRKDCHDHYETVVKEAYFDAIGMRGWQIAYKKDRAFKGPDDGVRFILDLEDMGRLGLLVLARGKWGGKQLIPAWFVQQLERKQTYGMLINYDGPNDGKVGLDPEKFPEVPYGLMTWVNTDGDLMPGADRRWAYAAGAGGHLTMWNRRFGIVFAAAGAQDATRVANILEKHLRAPKSAPAGPVSPEAAAGVAGRCAGNKRTIPHLHAAPFSGGANRQSNAGQGLLHSYDSVSDLKVSPGGKMSNVSKSFATFKAGSHFAKLSVSTGDTRVDICGVSGGGSLPESEESLPCSGVSGT